MKKISNLGKVLSRDEARKIVGGDYGEDINKSSKCSASACETSCSCNTEGTNSCSSTSNSASCNCDGITVTISC